MHLYQVHEIKQPKFAMAESFKGLLSLKEFF